MKSRRIAALLACALAFSTVTNIAHADNPPRKILTGWLPYYGMKTALPSTIVNADLIQEISPFWYTIKDPTKITDLYTPANPSIPIDQPLATLRSLNISIIPTITDGTAKGVMAGWLAKDATRSTIVKTITDFVVTNNYQGIDLDFENFAFVDGNASWPTTLPNWVKFSQELGTALHAQGKLLSMTTPVLFNPLSGKKGYYVYGWAQIAPFIDRLRIMTYDYSVATPGPIGPITWVEQALQFAVSVMPASKVFVGVAGYGRDWITKVDGTCPASVANTVVAGAKAATFVMRNAATLASDYNETPTYVAKYGESTFTYQKSYPGSTKAGLATTCTATRTVWYQDQQGYALRANLVSKYHIGGIAAWTMGMEDPLATDAIRTFAKSIAPDPVLANLSIDKESVNYGQAVNITGLFTLKDNRPLAGLPVRFEAKSSAQDWHSIFTGVTGVDGKVSARVLFGKSTSLRAISDGSWMVLEGRTLEKSISVARLITWRAPASIKHGVAYQLTGAISPRVAGVSVQLNFGGAQSAVTDSDGKFVFTISSKVTGFTDAQLSVAGDSQFAQVTSDPFTILVR